MTGRMLFTVEGERGRRRGSKVSLRVFGTVNHYSHLCITGLRLNLVEEIGLFRAQHAI
jgi:hypothetical protein